MRRVDSSMRKSTASRLSPQPVQTSTVKKSAAARTSPLRLQELGPRRLFQPIRFGLQAVFTEDGGDGAAGDLMLQVRQGSLDPRVAPPAVLGGHPRDQRADLAH